MDIFITGCAKTRTTLVHWLFSAFEGCVIMPSESSVFAFRHNLLHYINPGSFHPVAKRMYGSVLCGTKIKDESYKDQLARIQFDGIKIVSVVRNREDTLKSENGYVPPERYDFWLKEREAMRDMIAVEVDSDNLLVNPDYEQGKVAESLGLDIRDKWSDWPDFAPLNQIKAYIQYPKFLNRLGGAK